MMKILITGAGGYIARQLALELRGHGYFFVGIDNGVNCFDPDKFYEKVDMPFYMGDIGDTDLVKDIVNTHDIDAVIHCAGRIYVGESFNIPYEYYDNNTSCTLRFLKCALEQGVERIVFSSTAGIYGVTGNEPIPEAHPLLPITPYGRSKLAAEMVIRDLCATHRDSRFAFLRYFNVAGADPLGRTGQNSPRANHLIEVACEAALGLRSGLQIYGTDYPTPDGTCIRDYIHVADLVAAHRLALEHLGGHDSVVLNCGYGRGYSVREIIDAVKRVSGRNFPTSPAPRRPGDAPSLVADNRKVLATLPWTPHHADIDEIVASALAWKRQAVVALD